MRSASTTMPAHERASRGAAGSRAGSSSRAGSRARREECEMSRSCHSATFSSAGLGVAAQHPREAGDLLGLDRVALVRHRARALLARRGTAPATSRTSVRCRWRISVAKRSSPAPGQRDRLQQLGVAVARRRPAWRRPRAARPEPREHALPRTPGSCAAYVPTAPEIAPTATCANARSQALARCGAASNAKPASLTPNVVGSACTPCVRPTHSVSHVLARRARPAPRRARAAPGTISSPAARSCSASAVSSTSEEVRP